QSDVPGYTWGLSSVLAACGVKYISVGPNYGHRVGHTFHWADMPFYWVAPNGKDKVLFWMAGRGYSLFQRSGVGQYGGLADNQLLKYMDDVFAYLRELEEAGYPYETLMLRYSIGSDNGPPDPTLSAAVDHWNRRYASPRFVIDTNSNFLKTFEERHGDEIPRHAGDFTPYWEDGAASTAADLAVAREAAERLVQAQTLWSMRQAGPFPRERFDEAWTKLIMYDEHTWGAWNSISDPDNDFVKQQADYKQRYALDGREITGSLLAEAGPGVETTGVIDVYNTLYWDRSEVVFLSAQQSRAGDRVVDEAGQVVPSQRLASGELAFWAAEAPAFGARRFTVRAGEATTTGRVQIDKDSLTNGRVTVRVDPQTGAVSSLRHEDLSEDLVDRDTGYALNDYLYILGRDATKDRHAIDGGVRVSVEDAGPLVGTLRIESAAPGAHKLVRRIRLVSGCDRVELINTVDKTKERRPESVSFAFPFQVPGGVMQIDTPWAIWQPEKEQLPGANRNFFCVQRWVDISNGDHGVTWVTLDAPLVQWDPMQFGVSWNNPKLYRTELQPNQTMHSWVMNNHWETNYAADQQGRMTFRYVVWPHAGGFDAAAAQRMARSAHQPLLAFTADGDVAAPSRLLSVDGDGVLVTTVRPTRDGRGHVVRLFNTTDRPARATLNWLRGPADGWICNPTEEKLRPLDGSIELARQEIVTLRFEPRTP
ncbi:MAG: hypothetical protein JXB13_19100, partial [Phycisphaerae bacterium]|nr:hypothetical protein [Phycisphaerae bacterium]